MINNPILMYASTGAVASGSRAFVTDQSALKNPYATPIRVDEIHFFNSNTANTGGMQVKLDFGNYSLTNEFVPLNLFARKRTTSASALGVVTWILSSPLYMYQNEFVLPQFYYTGTLGVNSSTTQFWIAFSGCAVARVPKKRTLPWVAGYVANVSASNADTYQESTESDLQLPFDNGCIVAGMIGDINFANPASQQLAIASASSLGGIRLVDADGMSTAPQTVPFGQLFGTQNRALPFMQKAPPHSFFKVYLEEIYSTVPAGQSVQLQVAVHATREIEG